ncbi:MAG TPA: hypothetical protein VFC62_03510, partial [Atopostipes sp.]|nr:hypothetical protein [Atopostipes sp.]
KRRRKAMYDLIEAEIRNYHETKRELEQLKSEIIESTPVSDVPAYTGPGDPTAQKAIKLRTSRVIMEVEKRVNAVGYALETYKHHEDPARYKFIKLWYFDNRFTPEGVIQQVCISRRTFYNWRDEFVGLVAERLGWEL